MPVQGEGPKDMSKSTEHRNIPPQPDQQLTQDFLNGVYCLRGVREHPIYSSSIICIICTFWKDISSFSSFHLLVKRL